MKRLFLSAAALALWGVASAFAAPPVAFFSDLTSGPGTGGKDNNGLFVTVVGKNFGASRGTGYVAIGGGRAADYVLWTDKKITFQLGSQAKTGEIKVATSEGTSNGLRFVVRPGNIYFVDDTSPNATGSGTYQDPWRSPRSYFTAMKPGDTCYFRQGTYAGRYGNQTSRPYNVSFYNSGAPSGAQDNEIAWVGYPGETALFKANDNTVYNGAFEMTDAQYYVIAGLSIYGRGDGREQVRINSSNNDLINCKVEGIKTLSYGMIGVTASNLRILGNELFGARSGNKLDHVIYFQGGGGDIDNIDVGWNYIHDNDIAVGPVFSWNRPGSQSTNIRIHDNLIDCSNSSEALRLAGIWSGGGGSIYFYNNLVIEAGANLNNDNAYNAIYVGFGTCYIYNNTFHRSRGAGSSHVINVYNGASAVVKNNIFNNQSNCEYVNLASGSLVLDSNCYFGGAGGIPAGDPRPVKLNPGFVNASALDLHLAAGSPCVDKGVDLTSVCPTDYDGTARTAGKIDIGAFEYYVPSAVTGGATETTGSITGSVKDLAGQGVPDVTVRITGAATASAQTAADGSFQLSDVAQGGSITIAPEKSGWVFTPSSVVIPVFSGNLAGQNFTARRTYSINGRVLDVNGAPLRSVEISLSGEVSRSVTTAADGSYELTGLPENASCTVRSNLSGYHFEPSVRSTSALSAAMNGWDFEAVNVNESLVFGELKVIGSSAGKGTINPEKGDTSRIYFRGEHPGTFECRVFTASGELVWESKAANTRDGTFEWVPDQAASGIYTVHVKGPGFDRKEKIAVVK